MSDWWDDDSDGAATTQMRRASRLPNGLGISPRARRITLIVVIFLIALTIVDRVSVLGAQRVASAQIVSHIPTDTSAIRKPHVKINGFPFLTQVITGRYKSIDLTINGLCTIGPRLDAIHAHLTGTHMSVVKALSNKTSQVSVDRATLAIGVTYGDVNTYLSRYPGSPNVESNNGALRISETIPKANNQQARVFLSAGISTAASGFSIQPNQLGVEGFGTLDLPKASIPVSVPEGSLPPNLDVTGAVLEPNDVQLSLSGSSVLLPTKAKGQAIFKGVHSSPGCRAPVTN